jgi:hypothetical protein
VQNILALRKFLSIGVPIRILTIASKGVTMGLDRESLKKMFPNLGKELQLDENKVAVKSVRTDPNTGEKAANRETFVNYVPDVIDFLRRCDTKEQAEEIITYMEKRGEINKEFAEKLRVQLKRKGVRSFGPKKEESYYLKNSET